MPAASFRVYQDNAQNSDEELPAAVGGGGGTNAHKSFQPQHGAVREVGSYDSMAVRATDSSETCSSMRFRRHPAETTETAETRV